MSNKDTYKRKHAYLDKQINTLSKNTIHIIVRSLPISKKKKLKLKDRMIYEERDKARYNKYKAHEYFKRALSMTA